MVTHRMEDIFAVEVFLGEGDIFREAEFIIDPVQVPSHIAEREEILGAGRGRHRFLEVLHYLVELRDVLVAVRQVHVTQDEEGEILILDPLQREVPPLRRLHGRLLVEGGVEFRHNALQGRQIAGRDDDEDILPALIGLDLVDTLRIGLDNLISVRDQDIGNSHAVAGYGAVEVDARPRVNHDGDVEVDVGLADVIPPSVVEQEERIKARRDAAVGLYAE